MAGKFWTQSWSPIVGCDPLMPCARRCWALAMVLRMFGSGVLKECNRNLVSIDMDGRQMWTGEHCLVERWLDKPLKRRKPSIYATGWHGDMWREIRSLEDNRENMIHMAMDSLLHQFLFLTKCAGEMSTALAWYLEQLWDEGFSGWPDNLWFGTTVTNQPDADERIPHLLRIPGRRWVIYEPLTGPASTPRKFDELADGEIDWVVVGAGTNGYKPPKAKWVQEIIDACRSCGVPVWTKALPPGVQPVRQMPAELAAIARTDKHIMVECSRLGVEVEG